jgi:4-hydroxybenzoate polyprenyltransferase
MATLSLIKERLDQYEKLMRLDKPIGILLLLWPTLWAVWIASGGRPHWVFLAIFVLGTVLMRSAGCVINDYADREFDPHVERTKARPLAAGTVTVREAFALAGFLVLCAFLLILPILTPLLFGLAVAALFLAASYPFTKRFFAIPQAYLGVAFGFGIPMAFAAIAGEVPAFAWQMLAANIFWAIAYDTEYALVDIEDDKKIGIKTSALTFGRFAVSAISVISSFGSTGTSMRFSSPHASSRRMNSRRSWAAFMGRSSNRGRCRRRSRRRTSCCAERP